MGSSSLRFTLARRTLSAITFLLLGYVAVLALLPELRDRMPAGLRWFGEPASWVSIAIVTALLILLGLLIFQAHGVRHTGAPLAVVVGLALISLTLALAAYWDCHDESHPRFFTPLMWTAGVVKGGTGDQSLNSGTCPSPTPVALEIARLCALFAVFLSVVGVALALFRSRMDRLRVYFARSVTALVGVDEDSEPMVSAIARTLGHSSTLVVVTSVPDTQYVSAARQHGARIVTTDFARAEALASLPFWHKLDRLYLLSIDPSSNVQRLGIITKRLSEVVQRQRIPLIVRIDDPWQAIAWRAQHFGGAETRWAADTVGKYEVTARRLLDQIVADPQIERILVCGTSPLTLALCADMAQRQLEQDYYSAPDAAPLPRLTLISENAEEYRHDHEYLREQLGLPPRRPTVEALNEDPSVAQVMSMVGAQNGRDTTAVILVDGATSEVSKGTRLAARLLTTPIWAWDPNAGGSESPVSLVGRLRTYRLSMDLPGGQAHDAWERAARLIHERYAAAAGHATPASAPWVELDEFYRGSNRRQVQNALWMVEKIGGHTWNTFGSPPDSLSITALGEKNPLEQLLLMGFDRETAIAMARAEHEDWCRYYVRAGWKFGTPRDDSRKVHDKLVDWSVIEADAALLDKALGSLAGTLLKLRELGYRSRPRDDAASARDGDDDQWRRFRQTGTVMAERRDEAWTWKTRSGQTMQASAGDWAVKDSADGQLWSVRDDIFRARYEHVDGRCWRRYGTVEARPARDGEIVDTLEGPVTAAAGDWVVRGEHGDHWPVPGDEFAQRYEGPLPP
ncbi:hypothetical protein AU190_04320 [Mycolicibacterium acapulense]|nr:hypothetical protein AU189_21015 [Mycolicibacterium acapulense]KUI09689.1 hypothetical protein AU190_04320 [Mycolicibacterium acapulense]